MKTLQLSDYKMLLSKWSSFYNFLLKAIWSLIIKDLSSSLRETFASLFQYNNKAIFCIKTFQEDLLLHWNFPKEKTWDITPKAVNLNLSLYCISQVQCLGGMCYIIHFSISCTIHEVFSSLHFSISNSFNSFSSHVKRKQIKERNLSALLEDAS